MSDILLISLDVTDLTAVGAFARRAALLDRGLHTRRHRRLAAASTSVLALETAGGGQGGSHATFLFLALFTTLAVFLEAFFLFAQPGETKCAQVSSPNRTVTTVLWCQ